MGVARTLILVPTALEARIIFDREPQDGERLEEFDDQPVFAYAGFGLSAAGIKAAHYLLEIRPERCLLLGIAGTYDPALAPVGEVACAESVVCDGIGVGEGRRFETSDAMGFRQLEGIEPGALDVRGIPTIEARGLMVSAAAASGNPDEAARRRLRHPAALLEDMEAWSVALACRHASVPLSVVRGVSNVVGDRDAVGWKTVPALRALRKLLPVLLSN